MTPKPLCVSHKNAEGLRRPTRSPVGCVRHFLSLPMLVLTISETYSYLQVANGPSQILVSEAAAIFELSWNRRRPSALQAAALRPKVLINYPINDT